MTSWPKKPVCWIENRILNISIPFTWELPGVFSGLLQRSAFWDHVFVGGPAVELMPGFFDKLDYVEESHSCEGVLQRINPMATRTTLGCIRHCRFCAVDKIEGGFKELTDWPDLPVICDNNLLAAYKSHFDKVIDRLRVYGWADFNQGLDHRLLTGYHARKLAEIKKPMIRLALDHMDFREEWENAFQWLRHFKISKKNITSYCLIGFKDSPREAWQRCEWIEGHGIKAYPMWFHELDQLRKNIVTERQDNLGWTEEKRKEIMGYYYKHRGLKNESGKI